ncbi:hypothetical protein SacmaDRAFT_5500, partial [Saccharomonospora marina XMU15]
GGRRGGSTGGCPGLGSDLCCSTRGGGSTLANSGRDRSTSGGSIRGGSGRSGSTRCGGCACWGACCGRGGSGRAGSSRCGSARNCSGRGASGRGGGCLLGGGGVACGRGDCRGNGPEPMGSRLGATGGGGGSSLGREGAWRRGRAGGAACASAALGSGGLPCCLGGAGRSAVWKRGRWPVCLATTSETLIPPCVSSERLRLRSAFLRLSWACARHFAAWGVIPGASWSSDTHSPFTLAGHATRRAICYLIAAWAAFVIVRIYAVRDDIAATLFYAELFRHLLRDT